MWKEALLLIAVIGCVTSQQEQVKEDDKTIDDAAGGSENPVDMPLSEDTDAAMDALANYMGFTCPKGHRCLPVLECLPCDYGTYKDNEGSDLCKRCPPDCTTLRKGAQSREECVPFCPPGYEISECGKTCTRCRPGTYKSTWEKSTQCTPCPLGSNPPADGIGMNNESQCYPEDEPFIESITDGSLTTQVPPTVPTVTVTCESASDCGFGGACYNGYCGCLTTSCSRLAYAAMPGCKYFCQCEITTQTWRLHSCNVQELFDEKIDNCNWNYNVDADLCFSAVNCENLIDTCAPPTSADKCSYDTRKYMTCLRNLHAQCTRSPVNELSAASGEIDADLYTKLMALLSPITSVDEMESVYNDYVLECLDDHSEPATTTPGAAETTAARTPTTATEDETITETTTDNLLTTQVSPTVPTATVTCQSASDCGFGGACYNGYCGCLTTSCSRLAYAAMPGCKYFCQCEITTQTWRLHSCNVQELFDEKIDNCNWNYNVDADLCFSVVNCEIDTCAPPASADICSYDSRKYMTCLRNLHAQCTRNPNNEVSDASGSIDADLYTKLMALLSPITSVDEMESVYNDYVLECLDDHSEPATTTPGAAETTSTRKPTTATADCPVSCPLPPAEEANLCSAIVDQYFACLDVCSAEAANDLLNAYPSLHPDIRSKLTPMVNNGDTWEYIYAWYLYECPGEVPKTTKTLTTPKRPTFADYTTAEERITDTPPSTVETATVTCQSARDCGPGGGCYGGYCGCLTSTCSDLAYVAMPGCGYFCQCEVATETWRLHSCNSHELFDEKINNCNWNFSVAENLCFSTVNCDLDSCAPPASVDICSIGTRTYMTCLRGLYVQCERRPVGELGEAEGQIDTALYEELMRLVGTVETVADMESVYYSYMHDCLAGTNV